MSDVKYSESDAVYERILDAAGHLFARQGYEATGIRAIAVSVGLSSSTLYHYFPTKEVLLIQIMQQGMARLFEMVDKVMVVTRTPEETIVGLVYGHITIHVEQYPVTLVADNELRALSERGFDEVMVLRDTYEDKWSSVVLAGVEQGKFNVPDTSLARLALLDMCTSVARWYRADGRLNVREVGQVYADMALRLLAGQEKLHGTVRLSTRDIIDKVDKVLHFTNNSYRLGTR